MADGNKTFAQVMAQMGDFVKGLTLAQRLLLAGGAAAVAITLFVFVRLIAKPEYKPLYSGLEARDAQALGDKLKAKNIPFQLSADGGAISVAADKLDAARLEVASAPMPRSGRLGFELFDKTNWAGTDFSEKVNFQRALEGELERTIQTLSDVETARVHLVLPTDSLFADRQHEAKAAVMLKLRNARLPEEAQTAIARLVAASVDQLRPENVTVVDADTGRPLGAVATGPSGMAGSELEKQLAARLVQTLEPVVGADRVRASVRVEYDLSTSEESEEKYDPGTTVALTMQKREELSGGTGVGGVPGAASNVPSGQAKPATTTSDSQRSSRSEDGTYAVNRTVRHVSNPAGRVKRITAALLVDDASERQTENGATREVRRKRSTDEMKQIETLARAALGLEASRGDVIAVENLSFQSPVSPEAPRATPVQRVRTELTRWGDIVRLGLILLLFLAVYMVLFRPIKRQFINSFRQVPRRLNATDKQVIAADNDRMLDADEIGLPTAGPGAKKMAALKRNLAEKIKAEPAAATRLVQTWLQQDEG